MATKQCARALVSRSHPSHAEAWRCFRHAAPARPAGAIAAGLLAAQLVGEPITLNLVVGLIAVFAGIWIATTEPRTS
jgi:hypothetical protein